MNNNVVLEVKNIKKWFPQNRNIFGKPSYYIKAVNDLSFSVYRNETLSIVGESGCGKSTLCRAMIGLIEADSGQVIYNDTDILKLSYNQMRKFRKDFQMIFQDPYSSLNPRMTVGDIISEPMDIQKELSKVDRMKRLVELMGQCGLDPSYMSRYPHEFSGGQRQRISIARSLSSSPKIIICDEPVSALDVSIQSQILNLLKQVQRDYELTLVFVSHDLNVVHHISDRIIVMYLGHIMESGTKEDIFKDTKHPYTKMLLASIPGREDKRDMEALLNDTIPNPADLPKGCVFHDRCDKCSDICRTQKPELKITDNDHHYVACHFA